MDPASDHDKGQDGPPSALDRIEEIRSRAKGRKVALFLDYDGTLTRIVRHPEQAVLPDSVRGLLSRLSERFPVAVISGRDLADLRRKVGIPGLYYGGSHGFDIAGPEPIQIRKEEGVEYLPYLDRVERALRERSDSVPGAWVERKRFSVTLHYRAVKDEDAGRVEEAAWEVSARHPQLRRTAGKKIYEFQPALDWHKGKAVLWLLSHLSYGRTESIPFSIGDDESDEDVFRELKSFGVTIAVMDPVRPTEAGYRLKDPVQVELFLEQLLSFE